MAKEIKKKITKLKAKLNHLEKVKKETLKTNRNIFFSSIIDEFINRNTIK